MRKLRAVYHVVLPNSGNFQTVNRTIEVGDTTTMTDLDGLIAKEGDAIRNEITIRESARVFEDE